MAWIVGQAPVDIQNFHRPLCLPGKALLCSTHDSPARSAHGTRPAKTQPRSPVLMPTCYSANYAA